jgi:hypothetical protein
MRRSDSGQGSGKAFLALLIVVALGYLGIKTIPVYVNNYQLGDYIRDLAVRATVERPPAERLQGDVVAKAQSLDLPVTAGNVKVTVTNEKVIIRVDYTVPIDLKLYTLNLHFTPSAENHAL